MAPCYTAAELTAEVGRVLLAHPEGWLTSGRAREDGQGTEFTTTNVDLSEAEDPAAVLGSRYPTSVVYGEPAEPA